MKLYYSVNSPYARKVRVAALEKGIADRLEYIAVNSLENSPELIAVNPLCKVPALVLENGHAIVDSPLITEYLDSLDDRVRLFPASPERWPVLARAALAHGVMDAAVGLVVQSRLPEEQRSFLWRERYENAILRTLAQLARDVPDPAITDISTINLAVALEYLDFRLPYLSWKSQFPNLATWGKMFSTRESMRNTRPQP